MPAVALQHREKPGRTQRDMDRLRRKLPVRTRGTVTPKPGATRSIAMMDVLMLALGFGFFALAIGYTYVCERL
jgi:hypothetical protein